MYMHFFYLTQDDCINEYYLVTLKLSDPFNKGRDF